MNCKPDDMAMIVRVDAQVDEKFLGLIIHVTSLSVPNVYGELCWAYGGKRLFDSRGYEATGFPDDFLRPIRPGEGEDETLSWCPVPSKVTA